MLKVLVTGASGWIGRALLNQLNTRGLCIPVAGLRYEQEFPYQQLVLGDLSLSQTGLIHLKDIDVVVHCAGLAHAMQETGENSLLPFRQVNVEGTRRLLAAVAKSKVKRFVYVSSVKVNGEQSPSGRGFNEDDLPIPEDAYGLSKFEAEQLVRSFCEQNGIEWVIVRPPLVYGVGAKANFLKLMHLLRRRLPLPLGALHNRRSMIAIHNLVDFLSVCVFHPKAANEVFLISDGEDLSLTQMCSILASYTGGRPWLVPVPASILKMSLILLGRKGVADRLCRELRIDIRKSRELLNWQPIITPNKALLDTALYWNFQ